MSTIFSDNYKPAQSKRLRQLKARRKVWLTVHLWLGLVLGLFLSVIGVTGSLLVFWQDIDELLNPTLLTVEQPTPGQPYQPITQITASVNAALPKQATLNYVEYPRNGTAAFTVFYKIPTDQPDSWTVLTLSIDPYTAKPLGRKIFYAASNPLEHRFIGFIFKLHYALLLKGTGVTLVGVIAVLLVISVLTGLIVWWPLTGKWRQAFMIKCNASSERFVFDLHKSLGAYVTVVLLAVLVSGVYMNLPDQFIWLVHRLAPDDAHAITSSTAEGQSQLGFDAIMNIAAQRYPNDQLSSAYYPDTPTGVYELCYKNATGLQSHIIDSRCLLMDQYNGNILKIKDQAHNNPADSFIAWQWPLHSGQAFGWTGRMLVFLSGLACPVLFITGVIRWLQKHNAQKHKIKIKGCNHQSSR